jgi:hypothetical protein
MIVNCRRSTELEVRFAEVDRDDIAAASPAQPILKLVPHLEQNLASAELTRPQDGHGRDSAAPHLTQNSLPSATLALQVWQCIDHYSNKITISKGYVSVTSAGPQQLRAQKRELLQRTHCQRTGGSLP